MNEEGPSIRMDLDEEKNGHAGNEITTPRASSIELIHLQLTYESHEPCGVCSAPILCKAALRTHCIAQSRNDNEWPTKTKQQFYNVTESVSSSIGDAGFR